MSKLPGSGLDIHELRAARRPSVRSTNACCSTCKEYVKEEKRNRVERSLSVWRNKMLRVTSVTRPIVIAISLGAQSAYICTIRKIMYTIFGPCKISAHVQPTLRVRTGERAIVLIELMTMPFLLQSSKTLLPGHHPQDSLSLSTDAVRYRMPPFGADKINYALLVSC